MAPNPLSAASSGLWYVLLTYSSMMFGIEWLKFWIWIHCLPALVETINNKLLPKVGTAQRSGGATQVIGDKNVYASGAMMSLQYSWMQPLRGIFAHQQEGIEWGCKGLSLVWLNCAHPFLKFDDICFCHDWGCCCGSHGAAKWWDAFYRGGAAAE